MKPGKFLAGVILVGGLLGACNKDKDEDLHSTDRTFMMEVGYGNHAEIEAGQLASTRATNTGVQMFGQMMVTDHTMADTELEGIADRYGLDLPDEPDTEHKMLMQRLMTLQGLAFDTAYMNSQVADHLKTIQLFENEIANGQEQWVKDYANKHLPHIRMHYQKADSLAKALR